jgi:hypothetical protein
VTDFLAKYTPYWLYLDEFMRALRGASEEEKREAILLLVRDRLIINGKIDETHFRFLGGKPQIDDASWLAGLSEDDVAWDSSSIRTASIDPFAAPSWHLIEIATSCLTLFGFQKTTTEENKPKRALTRTKAEQERAKTAMMEIYGKIPPQTEVSNKVLGKAVNENLEQKGLKAVKADALQRAAGRRK